jgi:hypothetical protein
MTMGKPIEWPTREEWAAKAEYSVRTRCTARERLPEDAVFITDAELARARGLSARAAELLRPMLTAEIVRLTALLPAKPTSRRSSEHVAWFLALPDEQYETAGNLAAMIDMRKQVARGVREGTWGNIAWHLSRIDRHHPPLQLRGELLDLYTELAEISDAVTERTDTEAKRLEAAAIAREVAKRNSDEGWAHELERRAGIDAGPKVTFHPA